MVFNLPVQPAKGLPPAHLIRVDRQGDDAALSHSRRPVEETHPIHIPRTPVGLADESDVVRGPCVLRYSPWRTLVAAGRIPQHTVERQLIKVDQAVARPRSGCSRLCCMAAAPASIVCANGTPNSQGPPSQGVGGPGDLWPVDML